MAILSVAAIAAAAEALQPSSAAVAPSAPLEVHVVATDSVTLRVSWQPVADQLGQVEAYTVAVRDSASGAILARNSTTSSMSLTFKLPSPATGKQTTLAFEVTAYRRGLTSSPGVAYHRLESPDAPPPAPGGITIDTIAGIPDIAMVGVAPGAPCRMLVATALGRISGDTAYFIRALPELPATRYCVADQLAVLLEGDVVGPTSEPGDPITTWVFAPGEDLPVTVPAAPPVRAGA